ncbi:WD40 repeat-like protein [Periconia macrospinosa]|uniref:WD40 repeat-like protein n=1 Tax=Periconia macrospinosa TaxID=97972 RepID=A0A2V1DV95_9PLEO|nr:WD40 repeat-like protein [Periconia macrospinosa]
MTSCPWNRIGFNDEIALRHHTRIHHSKDNPRLAPAKARLLSPAASVDLIRRQDRSNLKDSRLPTFSYKREKGRRTLAEDYLDRVSPNHVRQGGDWFAFFEPHQPRVLDIELVHTLPHERVVFSVSFSSCGLYLATGSYRAVSLYDVATGTTIQKCTYDDTRPDLQYVRAVRFHPDSTKIISGGEDGAVRVWDFSARQCQKWKAHELFIRGLDIGNNGNLIATGSEDRTVRLWTSASEETNMFSDYNTPNKFRQFDLKVAAMSVSISPDCRVVAAGLVNGVVCVWDIATGSLTARLTHDDTVYGVAFNPSSSHIISGSRDKTVKYWELDPNMQQKSKMGSFGHSDVQVHEGHDDFVMETTMTPDAPWLISGSEDKSVRIVDADTGALQCIIVGHTGSVLSVQCSPTGEYFATGSHDETVRIWQYVFKPVHPWPVTDGLFILEDGFCLQIDAGTNRMSTH